MSDEDNKLEEDIFLDDFEFLDGTDYIDTSEFVAIGDEEWEEDQKKNDNLYEQTPEEIKEEKREHAKMLENEEFLPKNNEFSEETYATLDYVEANPKKYIIEECIPACKELWAKNVYTFMVSDHENKGECWVEVITDDLSDENKEIYMNLSGDDVKKFSYHRGCVNFGVKCVGKEGQEKLLELAKQFQMQDVPLERAYISMQDFLIRYCGCYDEIPNPNYRYMAPMFKINFSDDIEMGDYIEKYEEWKSSQESKKTIKKFNPNKLTKTASEVAKEKGMIIDGDRVYLSEFHYKKHQNYLNSLEDKVVLE